MKKCMRFWVMFLLLVLTFYVYGKETEVFLVDENGNVGIGVDNPQAKLDVASGIKIADDARTCTEKIAGTLRYRNEKMQYCDGNLWQRLGGSLGMPDYDSGWIILEGVNEEPTLYHNLGTENTMVYIEGYCTDEAVHKPSYKVGIHHYASTFTGEWKIGGWWRNKTTNTITLQRYGADMEFFHKMRCRMWVIEGDE